MFALVKMSEPKLVSQYNLYSSESSSSSSTETPSIPENDIEHAPKKHFSEDEVHSGSEDESDVGQFIEELEKEEGRSDLLKAKRVSDFLFLDR